MEYVLVSASLTLCMHRRVEGVPRYFGDQEHELLYALENPELHAVTHGQSHEHIKIRGNSNSIQESTRGCVSKRMLLACKPLALPSATLSERAREDHQPVGRYILL